MSSLNNFSIVENTIATLYIKGVAEREKLQERLKLYDEVLAESKNIIKQRPELYKYLVDEGYIEEEETKPQSENLFDEAFNKSQIDGGYIICANGNIKYSKLPIKGEPIDLKQFRSESVMPIVKVALEKTAILFDLADLNNVMNAAVKLYDHPIFGVAARLFLSYFAQAFPCTTKFVTSNGKVVPTDLEEEFKRVAPELSGVIKFIGVVTSSEDVLNRLLTNHTYLSLLSSL